MGQAKRSVSMQCALSPQRALPSLHSSTGTAVWMVKIVGVSRSRVVAGSVVPGTDVPASVVAASVVVPAVVTFF